ncbi:helix-turn-helix transcriptional regulator [Bacillus luteolus]|uniref:Helix-turn-helix transcriptional regulator n=1 Tax=Litchfieldia luteola TaxID=682179 RepID=A0ABR9QKQ6_9BACI|nr:helix-turn-helix transcriptional regulator [Cytobacillus luteolus]MBE4909086.1 helix-turn-helix transcriptional regulator [Cytobacillus luteolus]
MQNRLREKRGEKNITQEQLSELVGVSRQTIISLENGKYNPSLELAFKLAKAFGCHIEDIFIYQEGE